ncbi:hypothetical protein D3C85_1499080 [compost metagenome]
MLLQVIQRSPRLHVHVAILHPDEPIFVQIGEGKTESMELIRMENAKWHRKFYVHLHNGAAISLGLRV